MDLEVETEVPTNDVDPDTQELKVPEQEPLEEATPGKDEAEPNTEEQQGHEEEQVSVLHPCQEQLGL